MDDSWSVFAKAQNLLGEDIEKLDDAFTVIDGEPMFTVGVDFRARQQ